MTSRRVLVLSSSSLSTYKRCSKAFELGYVRNLEPVITNEAVQSGSNFHTIMEAYANHARGTAMPKAPDDPEMLKVATGYINYKANKEFAQMKEILRIERQEALYTQIQPSQAFDGLLVDPPEVWLRTTFDVVYRRGNNWIVARDYKTFAQKPSYDVDLDFQSRIYVATLMQYYQTEDVEFEFEYVRRTVPKIYDAASKWLPEECYINIPVVISVDEARKLWSETQYVVAQILLDLQLQGQVGHEWPRKDLKTGPHSCDNCFYHRLCTADLNNVLDEATITEFANHREPLALPEGVR